MSEAMSNEMISDEQKEVDPMFYGVSTVKLVIMTIFTLGLYEFYWFYKNFELSEKRYNTGTIPFARALFSPLFCYSLFVSINSELEHSNSEKTLLAGMLAAVYFLLNLAARIPSGPFFLISFLVFLPLLGANQRINELNKAEDSSYEPYSKLTWKNWLFLLPLGSLTILMFIGMFLENA
jgi:hypothetical protein